MIRIRTSDGKTIPIPDNSFVELVSEDDTIGMAFFTVPGMIIQVQPGSADAQRYADMFGVQFNKALVNRR